MNGLLYAIIVDCEIFLRQAVHDMAFRIFYQRRYQYKIRLNTHIRVLLGGSSAYEQQD